MWFPSQPTFSSRSPVQWDQLQALETLDLSLLKWITPQNGPWMSWASTLQSSIYTIVIWNAWKKQVWIISLVLLINTFISSPGSQTHLNICMHIHMLTHVHGHTHAHAYIHAHAHMHTYTYTHMHTYMHIHTSNVLIFLHKFFYITVCQNTA